MANYVLVHGAWHGSWAWARVRRQLQAAGHNVFTPTLTGVADRSHLLSPDIDLDTHIADVVGLIDWEELSNVILCGHSYGGMVVTGVADRRGDRLRSLVYLDAFVPEQGQALLDLLPDEQREGVIAGTNAEGDGWRVPPIPAEVFNVNVDDRAWVQSQMTPQPIKTFSQSIELSSDGSPDVPISYMKAKDFAISPFGPFYEAAKNKGWAVHEFDCGHDVMIDAPDALSRLLLDLA